MYLYIFALYIRHNFDSSSCHPVNRLTKGLLSVLSSSVVAKSTICYGTFLSEIHKY